jgi:hypothetical protein
LAPHNPSSRPQARDEAEKLAIAGLSYLAGDPERLSRFLALSGLDLGHLRSAAGQPGFLSGVMAFIAGDEKTLLDFAAASGHAPEAVAAAHRTLNPDLSGEFG